MKERFFRHNGLQPFSQKVQDIERRSQLSRTLEQAYKLAEYADQIVVVPKVQSLAEEMEHLIPAQFIFGYSVPTRYGGTKIQPRYFRRPVHLLGGRPDVQRQLAELMSVVSIDCNRFTVDAAFGDYFDGSTFRPHPAGGYNRCIRDSVVNINGLWKTYPRGGQNNGR